MHNHYQTGYRAAAYCDSYADATETFTGGLLVNYVVHNCFIDFHGLSIIDVGTFPTF